MRTGVPLAEFLTPTYDYRVVAASLLIATLASYVALDLARREGRIREPGGIAWWVGGSVAMGTGIWSMHFVGMLAYSLPIQLGYGQGLTLLSWVAAVGVSGIALAVAGQGELTPWRLVAGSAAMAAGICAMHYIGMAAIALTPGIAWDAWLVVASMAIALAASAAALIIFVWLRKSDKRQALRQCEAALLMGAAISGMHYTGMAAAHVPAGAVCVTAGTIAPAGLLMLVVVSTCSILVLTLVLSLHAKSRRLAKSLLLVNEKLQLANAELQNQAFLDPLTRLPNRLLLEQRMRQAIARCERINHGDGGVAMRLAILFVDLDGFKPVNDSFGHQAGDLILRESAARLAGAVRKSDVVGRVGGDEFVVLAEDLAAVEDAQVLGGHLLECLGRPFEVEPGRELRIGASVGIAVFPDHGPAAKLIVNADSAMYASKRSGGGTCVLFQENMDDDPAEQLAMQSELRRAIERRELHLHYQPKIDSRDGTMVGVEALLRWQPARRGAVVPSVFIPLAERFGLIVALGDWVIDEACRQLRAWNDEGLATIAAVNVSALQVRRPGFVPGIAEALRRHGVAPSQLMCEITESIAMDDAVATRRALAELDKLGVQLSIDDFGTGYSSLGSLRELPARQLKIDRSFVQDLESSANARAVVDALVRLAHALDLSVVAEGVETAGQQRILVELSCDELQGFHLARPMSAAQFARWNAERDKHLVV